MNSAIRRSIWRSLLAFGPVVLAMAFIGWMVGEAALGAGLGAVVGIVGWVLILTQELRLKDATKALPEPDDMHPYTRTRLKPIRDLRKEIQMQIEESGKVWLAGSIGQDILAAADDLLVRSYELAEARRKVRDLLAPAAQSRKQLEQMGSANDTIRQALAAEVHNCERLEELGRTLDARLEESKAAMAELRSRIAGAIGSSVEDATSPDDLRDAVRRARSVGIAIQEAVDTLRLS
ncbi:MAG: hypothetical protein C4341_03020 [Armatimonadota bacterium]